MATTLDLNDLTQNKPVVFNAPFLKPDLVVPRENLLKKIQHFFRQEQIEIKMTSPILGIHGMGGVGKSHLAASYFHLTKSYKLRFWVSKPLDLGFKKLARILMLANNKDNFEKARSALKNWFEKNLGFLIVFDDCDLEELQDFIPKNTDILYTTRKIPLITANAALLKVPLMDISRQLTC